MRMRRMLLLVGLVMVVPGLTFAQTEWVDDPANPVIGPADPEAWDGGDRYPLAVIKVDGTYHLYFNGQEAGSPFLQSYDIGHATSSDGRLVAILGRFDDRNAIRVWDLESGAVETLDLPEEPDWPPLAYPLEFTADGRLVTSFASRLRDGCVHAPIDVVLFRWSSDSLGKVEAELELGGPRATGIRAGD